MLQNHSKCYPFYIKNLDNNIELSKLLLEVYNTIYVPCKNNYKTKFSTKDSVNLTYEVLESISPFLANRYLEEVKNGTIVFGKYDFSYTNYSRKSVNIRVINSHNIVTPMVSMHEFFHLLHLEKNSYKLDSENYYCYTETLGMLADFYFIQYVLNNKKELVEDVKSIISEYYSRFYDMANDTLVDGMLISIYKENRSLSKKSIERYVNKYALNPAYKKLLYFKNDSKMYYDEDVRYIYSFPQALYLSSKLYNNIDFRNKFIDIIRDLELMDYTKWQEKYYNSFIKNRRDLYDLFRSLRRNMYNLYNDDEKVKKLGGL